MIKYLLSCCCLTLIHVNSYSQAGLYISSGTSLYISPSNEVAIDQLGLKPSSAFVITGTNNVVRTTTIFHPAQNPYISRVFQLGATTAPFSGEITIFYEDGELNGIPENALTLNVYNGTNWMPIPNNVIRNAATNQVTTAAISGLNLNELTLAHFLIPLPLQWGAVTAYRQASGAQITWQTHDEENTAYFLVEKSDDGLRWQQVGQPVTAYNVKGEHSYSQVDATTTAAKAYYRIKQVDRNDQYNYSKVVSITALPGAVQATLYPNPVVSAVRIQSVQLPLTQVKVYDARGSLIKSEQVAHSLSHQLDLSKLPAGSYHVQLQFENGETATYPILKK